MAIKVSNKCARQQYELHHIGITSRKSQVREWLLLSTPVSLGYLTSCFVKMANDEKPLISKNVLYAGEGDIPTFEEGSKVNLVLSELFFC